MAQQIAVTAGLAGHEDLSKISIELGAHCFAFLAQFGALDPLRPDNDMSKINEQLEVIARLVDQQNSIAADAAHLSRDPLDGSKVKS